MNNTTIEYYNKNAGSYVDSTVSVDFTSVQDEFLEYMPVNGKILDLGCGSGRDTLYFLQKGYDVDAVDGSKQLCKLASTLTGINVKNMLFSDLNEKNLYDGIWACASILHLPAAELKDIFNKMIKALKDNGYIYTSFKYGTFEGERNGRHFTDFTEKSFDKFLEDIEGVKIKKRWLTGDVRPDRSGEKWLNLILQKTNF